MNLLSDIITYVRRLIKSPSDALITDALIIDYINRFWIMDVDARIQLFDLKTKYQFQTQPSVDKYNMPLYDVQTESTNPLQEIGMYPVYQGLIPPVYINGIQVPFQIQKSQFYNIWPNVVQNLGAVAQGNGGPGPYTLNFGILASTPPSNPPLDGLVRGHIDIAGIIATGNNVDPPSTDSAGASAAISSVPVTSVDSAVFITTIGADGQNIVVQDSGWWLEGNFNYGILMNPGKAPYGNTALSAGYSTTLNTINYLTGIATVQFDQNIPPGNNINVQCFLFQTGLPRGFLYYDNMITLRTAPDSQYLVECNGYLSPSAFFNTEAAIPFGYMAEYLARGAARKILADVGDIEQFQFYEPLFREQEMLVWKRSQRQFTASRTESIYSQGFGQGAGFNNNYGGGVTL